MSKRESRDASDSLPDRVDPLPEHLEVREERSVLGALTGNTIVRCTLCLETAPADEWRTLSHKTDCKYPIESYETANGDLVVQALGSTDEWLQTSTPVEREDAASIAPTTDAGVSGDVDWDAVEDELEEDR